MYDMFLYFLRFLKNILLYCCCTKFKNCNTVLPRLSVPRLFGIRLFDHFVLRHLMLISVLNDEFVEQFAALNIELTTSDVDGWFQADGPGHEHMDQQGIVDLV